MKYEVYADIEVDDVFSVFEFVSTGKNGSILKRVAFTKAEGDSAYNLEFGDVDDNDEINYYSVSDNGDRDKILATIFNIAIDYTKRFPERQIYFRGSTIARTRLYRLAIGLHFEELSAWFDIYADADGKFVPFVKNMKISTFLITRKKT
jgi:hypothetical protein